LCDRNRRLNRDRKQCDRNRRLSRDRKQCDRNRRLNRDRENRLSRKVEERKNLEVLDIEAWVKGARRPVKLTRCDV
jgi:hypothetical protein